jgi:hypothetical protein
MANVEVGGHARGANRAQTSAATGGRSDDSHVLIAVADEDRHRPRDQPTVNEAVPPSRTSWGLRPGVPLAALPYSILSGMSRPRGPVLRLDPGRAGSEALIKMFGVHTSSILKWIHRAATEHSVKPDPTGKAIVMEIDEMWHFLKKNAASVGSETLAIAIQANSLTGNVGIVIRPPSRRWSTASRDAR